MNKELNKRMDEVLKKIDEDLAHLDFPLDDDDFEYWRNKVIENKGEK